MLVNKHKHYIEELFPKKKEVDLKEEYRKIVDGDQEVHTGKEKQPCDEDKPSVVDHVKRRGSTKGAKSRTLNSPDVSASTGKVEPPHNSVVETAGKLTAKSSNRTVPAPSVDTVSRRRGKVAMGVLPKSGLSLKDKPEWNTT